MKTGVSAVATIAAVLRLYINTATAVGGLIEVDGGLLMAVRAREPGKGLLDLPGGFLEFGEDAETGLRREIREELNIEVENLRYFSTGPNTYTYRDFTYHTCDIFFTCQPVSLDGLAAHDDVQATCVRSPRDIDDDELAFSSMRRVAERIPRAVNYDPYAATTSRFTQSIIGTSWLPNPSKLYVANASR